MKHARKSPNAGAKLAAVAVIGVGGAMAFAPMSVAAFADDADPSTTATPPASDPPVTDPPAVDPPTVTPCSDYIIKRGDTLSAVAYAYGVDLATLEPLNPGIKAHRADYSLVFAGTHVHLPAGSCDQVHDVPAPPVATPPAAEGNHWRHYSGRWHWGHWHHGDWHKVSPPADTTPPASDPPPSADRFTPVIAPDGPGTASGYLAHPVSYWGPLIQQAAGLVGINVDSSQVEALILAESSGNPNAINDYDINAQNGDPSRGLMQTISATFNTWHVAGTSTNIYDPLANISAALNYIKDVYHGVIPSSPY